MDWNFELVAGPYDEPIEGVAWDGEGLLFALTGSAAGARGGDGRILRYDPRSSAVAEFRKYTNRTMGLAFSPEGNLYGCQAGSRRIVQFDREGSTSLLEYRMEGKLHNQPDDLAVDRQGRIWFSDPTGRLLASGPQWQGPLDYASVLRLERRADRTWIIRRMTSDTPSPSAVAVSPDQSTLYVAEGNGGGSIHELRAYPINEDGTLGAYRALHTFGRDHRGPHRGADGVCLDADGTIVACAGWQQSGPGPMVYVFAPTGRVLETHPLPGDRPTNCAFGDAGLTSLYVATYGGQLFRARNTGRRGFSLSAPG